MGPEKRGKGETDGGEKKTGAGADGWERETGGRRERKTGVG